MYMYISQFYISFLPMNFSSFPSPFPVGIPVVPRRVPRGGELTWALQAFAVQSPRLLIPAATLSETGLNRWGTRNPMGIAQKCLVHMEKIQKIYIYGG